MTRSRKRKLARIRAKLELPAKRATWVGVPLASVVLAGSAFAAPAATTARARIGSLQGVTLIAQKHAEDFPKEPILPTLFKGGTLKEQQAPDCGNYVKV